MDSATPDRPIRLVFRYQSSICSEEHDKVFALLGLVLDASKSAVDCAYPTRNPYRLLPTHRYCTGACNGTCGRKSGHLRLREYEGKMLYLATAVMHIAEKGPRTSNRLLLINDTVKAGGQG